MRGFLVHLTTYVVVIIGLATFNLMVPLGALWPGRRRCRPRSRAAHEVSTNQGWQFGRLRLTRSELGYWKL